MDSASWNQQLAWLKRHTPYTDKALERLNVHPHCRLAVRFHIDLKMVPIIESLADKVQLQVFPCHEDTTDKLGWQYLRENCSATLEPDWSAQACRGHIQDEHSYLCDLGGELIGWALDEEFQICAALEGTTSGLLYLQKKLADRPAAFPILNWNDAQLKREIHNEKMVGFSLWQTFSEVTRLSLHGKTVRLLGFGPVGRGIARTARNLGARVGIYDLNERACIQAAFEGFWTPSREELLSQAQVLVTATGASSVLKLDDLHHLPNDAFLLNAGHSEHEIATQIRNHPTRTKILPHIEELRPTSGTTIFLLAQGRLLNLAAGFGDTINAFDVTTAQLVDAISFMLQNGTDHQPGLQPIPDQFFLG